MPKRHREPEVDGRVEKQQWRKRLKPEQGDRISHLPEEIILKILSFLPAQTLIACQQLSHRLETLALDSQLWKALYYDNFIRPRASKIPGIRKQLASSSALCFSSRYSKWLEHDHLAREPCTDWKAHFKLRHNWSRGVCGVTEMQIANQPTMVAPLLVQIHGSMVITASSRDGLQVWSLESRQLLASLSPNARTDKDTRQTGIAPSSLAVSNTTLEDRIAVVVGFQAGHFCLYEVERVTSGIEYTDLRTAIQAQYRIGLLFDHAATNDDPITGVACESHYIATINGAQLLSLYLVSPKPQGGGSLAYPKLLSSLRSHTAWPPLCLSLRVQASGIIASVAYALPTYLAGWTVGLQELRITLEGIVIQSRLASAAQHGFIPLSRPPTARSTPRAEPTRGFEIHNSTSQPTSLSYSHPYLLASHADNTLTLYLAHSSEAGLNISSAYRLWGHTSSVSDVQVGDRGRAVSTATTGGVRVWELEGIPRKRGQGEGGVEVRSKSPMPHLEAKDSVATSIRGAGFDEERILLLCTEAEGQKLVVYNFNK